MLDNLTWRQKNIGLLAGTLLLALVAWSFALKKTVVLAGDCEEMEAKAALAKSAPEQIVDLKVELSGIDRVLGESYENNEEFQQLLLDKVSDYCQRKKLVLKEFPQPEARLENDYLVETNRVVVEGRFESLLELVYELEQKERLGKVAGVQFLSKKELRTRKLQLTAAIYLQNIKKATDA